MESVPYAVESLPYAVESLPYGNRESGIPAPESIDRKFHENQCVWNTQIKGLLSGCPKTLIWGAPKSQENTRISNFVDFPCFFKFWAYPNIVFLVTQVPKNP